MIVSLPPVVLSLEAIQNCGLHFHHSFRTTLLNDLFNETASGCRTEVHPPGMTAVVKFPCL